LLAAIISSRSSRGSARTGATLESTKALSIFDRTVLAEPCSPDIASTGWGPPGRSAANSQAITKTKSFRLERLRSGKRPSIDPPRSGTGSGNMPAGRRKRTGGNLFTRQPSGPIFDGAPLLVGEIKINVAVVLGDTDVDGALGSIKLCPGLEQIDL